MVEQRSPKPRVLSSNLSAPELKKDRFAVLFQFSDDNSMNSGGKTEGFSALCSVYKRFARNDMQSAEFESWCREINPLMRIREIRFAREIRLRRVKCLRAWVDLFHFTSRDSGIFHNLPSGKLFHISRKRDISLVFS